MIQEYRKTYFAALEAIAKHTGHSKMELHEYWKQKIFPFLLENPDNFTEIKEESTTRTLSEEGWKLFLTEFTHFKDKFQ